MSLKLVDIGVNLQHNSFDRDRAEVLARAKAAGVETLVLTGSSLKDSRAVLQIAQNEADWLYCTAGVHPHNARECNADTVKGLRDLAQHKEVVAIGECGLDFNRDFSPRPVQERWFATQIELACELKLPLFLHERDAHTRFVEILRSYRKELTAVVVHCFTGTGDELEQYLAMDLHIGITGWICDERRGQHLQQLVKQIPLNRLMLETDAPYLTPRTIRPKPANGRNEPAFLPYVLNTVAECRDESPQAVADATTATAYQFFGLAAK